MSENDTLRFLIFLVIIFAFCFFSSSELDVYQTHLSKTIFSPLCSLFGVCTWSSSSVTSTLLLRTSVTSKEFIHAYTYIFSSLSPRLFVNQSEMKITYLFSMPLFSSQHIYLTFSVFCLKSPNPLSTMAQPSINVTQKLLLCSVIRACMHVHAFLKHSALLHPLKTAASECGPAPLLPKVVSLSCIYERVCAYRKYQLT